MFLHRRGLSLIEVIVTVALISIAMILVAWLFQFGVRINRSAEERNALQGDRLRLSRKLQRTLANSYRSGNTAFYLNNPADRDDLALSIIVPESWNEDTQGAVFSGYDIYYRLASDDTLRFLHLDTAPAEVAVPLSEAEVRAAITADPGVVILKSITLMQLYVPANGTPTDFLVNPVGLRLAQQTSRETTLTTELTLKLVSP